MTRPTTTSTTRGCTCCQPDRQWLDDGTCATCGHAVLEQQLVPVLLQILCGGTGLSLWPNPQGFDARRKVKYGIGDGSGDRVGIYKGRWIEVEFKRHDGRQSAEQKIRQILVTRLGGIYAVVRNEAQARQLLERLRREIP